MKNLNNFISKVGQLKYLNLYLSFLKIEIPGILQIFTLLAFLSLFSTNLYLRIFFILLVTLLEMAYLTEKLFIFLNSEGKYYVRFDEFLANKKQILNGMFFYSFCIGIFFGLLTGIVGMILPPAIDESSLCSLVELVNKNFHCKLN